MRRFDDACKAWLATDPGRMQRLTWWRRSIWHRLRRRHAPLYRAAIAAIVPSLAPVFSYWFMSRPEAFWPTAALWSGFVFVASIICTLLAQPAARDPRAARSMGDVLMRTGELLRGMDPSGSSTASNLPLINSCLSLLEIYTLAITGLKREDVGVALAIFDPEGEDRLRILARETGSRRAIPDGTFSGRYSLGAHACNDGGYPRAVHDLRDFGYCAMESPTGSSGGYRSIYVFPIARSVDPEAEIIGYISVDSTRPFEFYGNMAHIMATDCNHIIKNIGRLIDGGAPDDRAA